MNSNQEKFLKELLAAFKIEAAEHHQAIVVNLLQLEKTFHLGQSASMVETIFREIHSLKGAARAVNLMQIEQLCMGMENVFHEIKNGKLTITPSMFDTFHKAASLIEILVTEIDTKQKSISDQNIKHLQLTLHSLTRKDDSYSQNPYHTPKDQFKAEVSLYSEKNTDIVENASILVAPEVSQAGNAIATQLSELHETGQKFIGNETVRVSTAKLYDLLRQAEELITFRTILSFQADEMQILANKFGSWRQKFEDINASKAIFSVNQLNKTDDVFNNKEFLKKIEDELFRHSSNFELLKRSSKRSIDELLLNIKKTLLFPFSSLLQIVPKIVRDLSQKYEKEINLSIIGSEIEIDKRILEEMKDPLIHLIRNCIDHGIESKTVRLKQGKPAIGTIAINIVQDQNQKIQLKISDDEGGINKEKLINSAIKSGAIRAEDVLNMSEHEISMLIFASGVSTSPFITDVSGRGLGLAIVEEKVSKMNGTIQIETTAGKGTTFIISLPQTLAAFRGILVKSSEQLFIIPTNFVTKAIQINQAALQTVESKKTILFNNESVAVVHLSSLLGINQRRSPKKSNDKLTALIVQILQKKMALVIDEVLGEHEGVIKNLGTQLQHVNNILGASLLGNGKIVLILNVPELIESAAQSTRSLEFMPESIATSQDEEQKSILVVEDSITVRNMLRNFIEAAGYKVQTAVDGAEGWSALKSENFDMVVADIEMPRMNGFELTMQIRNDQALKDVPIVLVTALDSDDDRQRGLEAGANAYIVKGSFEKSNLIETINRLI